MLLSRRRLLYGMEGLRKMALDLLDHAQAVEEKAAKLLGPENPDGFTLEDARRLHADADTELTRTLCLQKLMQGR